MRGYALVLAALVLTLVPAAASAETPDVIGGEACVETGTQPTTAHVNPGKCADIALGILDRVVNGWVL
jgi:hypothetical protein